jgi:hypothetical protein
MTNDIKTGGKKDKGFFDNILDSCLQFFESIIPAFERAFESISSAFESLFSHSSENKDFEGSNQSSKASIYSVVEKNTRRETKKTARQSIAELLTLKPLNGEEQEEEKRQKQNAFEKELKNSAKILVEDYVISNQDEMGGFVANDDEEKFKKIKEYFINIHKAQGLASDTEVTDLFNIDLKNEIIGYCKEFLQQNTSLTNQDQSMASQSPIFIADKNFFLKDDEAEKICEAFIRSKFTNEKGEADAEKTLNFFILSQSSKEQEIKKFIVDGRHDRVHNATDLTREVLKIMNQANQGNSSPEPSFFDHSSTLVMGEGSSPRAISGALRLTPAPSSTPRNSLREALQIIGDLISLSTPPNSPRK